MTQKNPPGYPLPDGVLGNDEIVCQLVFLPNRPEYWQAFLGAIGYMATWTAWERDASKRGKDAASNWREANELTMECWRMACLEELQDNVAAILALLGMKKDCCDDNIVYFDAPIPTTEIVPDEGTEPDYYGETAVTDWDDWKEHVCYNANIYVDNLKSISDEINSVVTSAIVNIGIVAAALVLAAFVGLVFPVAYAEAAALVAGLLAGATILTFADTADDIETARSSIVCALLEGRSLADAVEDALSSDTAWDVFFQFIDYDKATAVIYEGGYSGQYLSAETLATCDCDCVHFWSADSTNNPVIYQNANGAQFTMSAFSQFGFTNYLYGAFRFNAVASTGAWCGPMKIIDSISVSDGLNFTYVWTYNQTGGWIEQWGWDTPQACNYAIGLLVNETMGGFQIQRNAPGDAGCDTSTITVTLTYHDYQG